MEALPCSALTRASSRAARSSASSQPTSTNASCPRAAPPVALQPAAAHGRAQDAARMVLGPRHADADRRRIGIVGGRVQRDDLAVAHLDVVVAPVRGRRRATRDEPSPPGRRARPHRSHARPLTSLFVGRHVALRHGREAVEVLATAFTRRRHARRQHRQPPYVRPRRRSAGAGLLVATRTPVASLFGRRRHAATLRVPDARQDHRPVLRRGEAQPLRHHAPTPSTGAVTTGAAAGARPDARERGRRLLAVRRRAGRHLARRPERQVLRRVRRKARRARGTCAATR